MTRSDDDFDGWTMLSYGVTRSVILFLGSGVWPFVRSDRDGLGGLKSDRLSLIGVDSGCSRGAWFFSLIWCGCGLICWCLLDDCPDLLAHLLVVGRWIAKDGGDVEGV